MATLPFLTAYDPPGTSEGTLDPLGLYQIADLLAVELVPAVRERMQRIRFVTAMAVGSLVLEAADAAPPWREAAPFLVWEWLVVEAILRSRPDDPGIWAVPGTDVTRRALAQHDYLDARSYLKNPRVFGFHGVYKRLAVHLGLVDARLGPGPHAVALAEAWARDLGLRGLSGAGSMLSRWTQAVVRSLGATPPRTKPGWNAQAWAELAHALAPSTIGARETRVLHDLLHDAGDRRLGALSAIWALQTELDDEGYREELLHNRLAEREPGYTPLLEAIRTYERFARSLQDAFDILQAEAARPDAQGYHVPDIATDSDFQSSVAGMHEEFAAAHRALGDVPPKAVSVQRLFADRFAAFAEPMSAANCAIALCAHHEAVQRAKSADGKRPWFDRIGEDRIYVRHRYREPRREIDPDRYVHQYRGWPIRRFHGDLS